MADGAEQNKSNRDRAKKNKDPAAKSDKPNPEPRPPQHQTVKVCYSVRKIDNWCGRRWLSMSFLEAGGRGPAGGGGDVGVVFIPSLGGTMRSLPALSLQAVCRRLGVPFLRYDATHLGASVMETTSIPGKVLTLWQDDAAQMVVGHAPGDRLVLVGFSLGATIAITLARELPKHIAGLILISPVVNLTEVLPRATRLPALFFLSSTLKTRVTFRELRAFQRDIRAHKFPCRKAAVRVDCPVRIVQGMKDTFPYSNAVRLSNVLGQENVTLDLVKEEDHYMHRIEGLRAITAALTNLLDHM